MNKYVRAIICVPCGILKMAWTKLFHIKSFSGPIISLISPHTEITLDNGAELRIGSNFKMRDGSKIRVRKGAVCKLGKNVSVNSNNMIVCHESVEIGDNCVIGACCVVKGVFPTNSVLVQKKQNHIYKIGEG